MNIAPSARVLIIGQAPGTRVHASGVPWDDKSGDRLRDWLGIDRETFNDASRIAMAPMGFCYPGAEPKGGDKPPRPECAPLWHQRIREHLTEIRLTLLVGSHAQKHYLGARAGTMTEIVAGFERHLPGYFPLPHPSWRVVGWQRRNPWFEDTVLPRLRQEFEAALS